MWVVKHSNRGKEEALSNHPNLLALGFAAQAGNKGDWYRAMQRVGRSGGVQGYRAVTAELSNLSHTCRAGPKQWSPLLLSEGRTNPQSPIKLCTRSPRCVPAEPMGRAGQGRELSDRSCTDVPPGRVLCCCKAAADRDLCQDP